MTGRESIGVQGLVEDVLGLNIRGLKTIRDSVIAPRKVADAARDFDWLGVYTPSIRIGFFLLSALSLLRFIWAPEDGQFFEFLKSQVAQAESGQSLSEDETSELIDRYFAVYVAALPFTHLIGQALAALCLPIWGAGTSVVVRLRLHYAATIPGLTAGFFLLVLFAFASTANELLILQGASFLVAMGFDTTTSFRMLPQTSFWARAWRAIVFGITATLFGLVTSVGTSIVTSMITF
ncbi:MAG: hypothetical protein AAF830_08480 [Pseudomonadota bacterium]